MSGVYTSETAIEARMLRPSASERLWKNCPTMPRSSTSGRNTTTVVSGEPTIAPPHVPRQQHERQEHAHRRERRAHDRTHDLARAAGHRLEQLVPRGVGRQRL